MTKPEANIVYLWAVERARQSRHTKPPIDVTGDDGIDAYLAVCFRHMTWMETLSGVTTYLLNRADSQSRLSGNCATDALTFDVDDKRRDVWQRASEDHHKTAEILRGWAQAFHDEATNPKNVGTAP